MSDGSRPETGYPNGRLTLHLPNVGVAGFDFLSVLLRQRTVKGRQGVNGCSLKDDELCGRLGDHGDRLDAGRSSPDDAHFFADKVDAFLGPRTGVINLALKLAVASNWRFIGHREAARCHYTIVCVQTFSTVCFHQPPSAGVIKLHLCDPRIERNVSPDVVAICDVVGVYKNLFL